MIPICYAYCCVNIVSPFSCFNNRNVYNNISQTHLELWSCNYYSFLNVHEDTLATNFQFSMKKLKHTVCFEVLLYLHISKIIIYYLREHFLYNIVLIVTLIIMCIIIICVLFLYQYYDKQYDKLTIDILHTSRSKYIIQIFWVIQRAVHTVNKTQRNKREEKCGGKGTYTKQVNNKNVDKFKSPGKKGSSQKSVLFIRSAKIFQSPTSNSFDHIQHLPVKLDSFLKSVAGLKI